MKEIRKRKPIRNHLITLLTLFGILLAADICASHAFYRPNKAKIENTFEREKSDVHIHADAPALAVYDNLENAEGFRDQKRKFPSHSSHFVCFDKLDYNLPIIFGLNSTTGEAAKEKLNDFLYANLMIKMLLEKYQNLQKSARELLSNQMPTRKKNTPNSISQSRNRTGQTLEPSSGKRPPIYQTRQDLDHASRRAMWRAPAIGDYAYGGSHTLQKSNIESLASLTAHEKTIGRDHQELTHLSTAERGAILAVRPQSLHRERTSQSQKEPVSIMGGIDALNKPGRALNDYGEKSQQSWVIRMLTNTMDYATNNEIEALFFLIMILGLVAFTTSLGRR